MSELYALVLDLTHPDNREAALLELSKKRETVPDLAPILWHSVGTIAALLQEIVTIYPLLSPPKLKAHASNRVCNALALLQCVASHQETRSLFLNGEASKNRFFFFLSFLCFLTTTFCSLRILPQRTFRCFCIRSSTRSARRVHSSTCASPVSA